MDEGDGSWRVRAVLDGAELPAWHQQSRSFRLRGDLGDAPWGCRLRAGGDKFAGAVANVAVAPGPAAPGALEAATAAFRAFYVAEASAAVDEARELAAFEAAWAAPPGDDDGAGDGDAQTDAKKAPDKGRKSDAPPPAKKGGKPPDKAPAAPPDDGGGPRLRDGAPDPPLHVPGATRVRETAVALKAGRAVATGLRVSERAAPGRYVVHVRDVSRDGFKRWSKAESEVFPALPDATVEFVVA